MCDLNIGLAELGSVVLGAEKKVIIYDIYYIYISKERAKNLYNLHVTIFPDAGVRFAGLLFSFLVFADLINKILIVRFRVAGN